MYEVCNIANDLTLDTIEAMEMAIQKAGRSKYGHEFDIRAAVNRDTGEIQLARYIEVVEEVEEMASALVGVTRPGDLVLTLGAGSIGQVGPQIVDVLKKRGPSGERSPKESDDVQ